MREVYCRSAKEALEKNNEIMVIVTTYETPNAVRQMLGEYEVDVKKCESDGSLVIIDSVQAYQMVTFYGVLKLIQLLAKRAENDGKDGIFSLADMGSFFLFDRENELVNYEVSIPKTIDMRLKAFCCYHENDFSFKLTKDHQTQLINHHHKAINPSIFH
ncbi:MAG: MEDS domain-containing protein [Pyrinomonadaceae bacterium]|nr:MEDS domain-containing protein [Pyrinomonadaceae bacterium]